MYEGRREKHLVPVAVPAQRQLDGTKASPMCLLVHNIAALTLRMVSSMGWWSEKWREGVLENQAQQITSSFATYAVCGTIARTLIFSGALSPCCLLRSSRTAIAPPTAAPVMQPVQFEQTRPNTFTGWMQTEKEVLS